MTIRTVFLANCPTVENVLRELAASGTLQALVLPAHTLATLGNLTRAAAECGIPVRPLSYRELHEEFADWLRRERIDCGVIYTFPFILPASVIEAPTQSFINLHYAPLPEYRGPDPLFWLIRNRAPFGGMSVHLVSEGLDEGDLVYEQRLPIDPRDTYASHRLKLGPLGPEAIRACLPMIEAGTLRERAYPQLDSGQHYYPTPTDEHRTIRWAEQDAEVVAALARACNPTSEGALCRLEAIPMRVLEAVPALRPEELSQDPVEPGQILQACAERGLLVACNNDTFVRLRVLANVEGFFSAQRLVEFGFNNTQRFR